MKFHLFAKMRRLVLEINQQGSVRFYGIPVWMKRVVRLYNEGIKEYDQQLKFSDLLRLLKNYTYLVPEGRDINKEVVYPVMSVYPRLQKLKLPPVQFLN